MKKFRGVGGLWPLGLTKMSFPNPANPVIGGWWTSISSLTASEKKLMLWIPKHLQSCFESAFKGSSQISIGEFPKIRDTLFGVLIIKLLLFRVLY